MQDETAPLDLFQYLRPEQLPYAVVAVALAWVSVRVLARFFEDLGERFTKRRLALKQLAIFSRILVILAAAIFVVTTLVQVTDRVLYALGGTAALAFGFAFKDIVASLIAGIILLFDRPFQVGDRIAFEDFYGEVTDIGLRSVRIQTLDDNLVSIPNNRFLTEAVASANAGALHQMVVVHFYIGCDQSFDVARRIVHDAAVSSRYVFLEKPILVHLKEGPVPGTATYFALDVFLKAYVFDGRFETAFVTDVTERVKRAFREHGIKTVGDGAPLAPAGGDSE